MTGGAQQGPGPWVDSPIQNPVSAGQKWPPSETLSPPVKPHPKLAAPTGTVRAVPSRLQIRSITLPDLCPDLGSNQSGKLCPAPYVQPSAPVAHQRTRIHDPSPLRWSKQAPLQSRCRQAWWQEVHTQGCAVPCTSAACLSLSPGWACTQVYICRPTVQVLRQKAHVSQKCKQKQWPPAACRSLHLAASRYMLWSLSSQACCPLGSERWFLSPPARQRVRRQARALTRRQGPNLVLAHRAATGGSVQKHHHHL